MKRTVLVAFRLTRPERAALGRAARELRVSLSTAIRVRALAGLAVHGDEPVDPKQLPLVIPIGRR